MTTTQRVTLATAAGALLAAGFWLLRPEEAAPPTAPPSAAAPVPGAVVAPPAPRADVAEAAAPTPAADAGPTAAAPAAPSSPTVELAPSPFTDANSEELRYAVQLVLGPETGPTEWRKAAEVFQRCVDENPTNHLCKRGVYAAYERLDSDGGPATTLTPPREFQPASAGPMRPAVERIRNENLAPVGPR